MSVPTNKHSHRLTLAPMMKYTDRHFRYLLRLMSKDIFLYTEMVTSGALIYGDSNRYLQYNDGEQPLALQIGGSDADDMQKVALIADKYHYNEININVGCPSDRVQSGLIGACLMAYPEKVASCIEQMKKVSNTPVTVKTRIGIDDQDDYAFLCALVDKVKDAGCETVIVHARKAWLNGLSPKENRDIPPLDYPRVYQLKKDYPDLNIVINGGIKTEAEMTEHLEHVDGVMIGRQLVDTPFVLCQWQQNLFNSNEESNVASTSGQPKDFYLSQELRMRIINQYMDYMDTQLALGVPAKHMVRHLINMLKGEKGAKQWRQFITSHMISKDSQTSINWLRDYINRYN